MAIRPATEKQKTHAEITEEMNCGPIPEHRHDREILRYYADRLDAAHKREIEATAAKCCQLGRLAGYGASEIKHQQESVGDPAKVREALLATLDMIFEIQNNNRSPLSKIVYAVRRKVKAALAGSPRNCDLPFKVEGTTWNVADKAWRVFKRTHPDAYFDTPNLVRCIEWLFATADESEVSK